MTESKPEPRTIPVTLAVIVLLVVVLLTALLVSLLSGGWKAEAPVNSFCDAQSLVNGAANRIYVSDTGAISVAAKDETC